MPFICFTLSVFDRALAQNAPVNAPVNILTDKNAGCLGNRAKARWVDTRASQERGFGKS